MNDARRNKTILHYAGICCLLAGLSMLPVTAPAQTGDTVRVGDTVSVDQDTSTVASGDKEGAAALSQDTAAPVFRSVPDSVAARWRKDPDFAYANDPAYWQQEHVDESPGLLWRLLTSRGFRYFFWILIGGILIYAIIRIIAENNMRLFYRSPRQKGSTAAREGRPDEVEEDLEGQLQHFLQIRDHRQAVRYLYLKSLRMLSDRGLIRLHLQSTNREYLAQLGNDPHRGPFSELTFAYEKVWYGEFPLNDTQFDRLHRYFEDFYKTVRS
jgi:Domain of unknown function (DUF4129)